MSSFFFSRMTFEPPNLEHCTQIKISTRKKLQRKSTYLSEELMAQVARNLGPSEASHVDRLFQRPVCRSTVDLALFA